MCFCVVVFDVVAGDLQVADLAVLNSNTAAAAVADVIVGDDCLVQVDPVQVNADPRVVVQMAVTHDDIAGSVRDVNCGSNFANQNACDRGLHDTDYLNPIGGRVAPFNFDVAEHWHAFSLPLFGAEAKRVGGLRMSRQ